MLLVMYSYTFPPEVENPRIDVDNIRTVRLLGSSVSHTHMMSGMVLMNMPNNNVLHVSNAKVLVLNCGLEVLYLCPLENCPCFPFGLMSPVKRYFDTM